MKIIDAHSHLDYISHNFQSDVVGTICCVTQESEWGKLSDIMKTDNCVYGAFGVHPWFAESISDGFEERLCNLLKQNQKYMIGEIGLDKYKPNMDKQMDVFTKQLNIAILFHRNIFLHCVGAWDKVLHILKQYKKSELPIIVAHAFNEKDVILNNLLKNYNVMFSVDKNAVYGKNSRIQQIPLNKILVETDGKSGVVLKDMINKISEIKNESDIDDVIYNNTLKVLNNE